MGFGSGRMSQQSGAAACAWRPRIYFYSHELVVQPRRGAPAPKRRGNQAEGDLADLSPDYTDDEIGHIWTGNCFAERYLLSEALGLDLSQTRTLTCPLIVFAGRHDMNVNSQLAYDWFETVTAPEKHFVWFEHSAHLPMTEERDKYLVSLLQYAKSISERTGDGA
jgi:proline iminopeptidase